MHTIRQNGRIVSYPWIWMVSLFVLGILAVLFSLRLLSDPDLGFHLNAGRWIIDHMAIPKTDIATYTVPEHDYVDLHWLFQVIIYTLFQLSGYPGLSILVCVLVSLLLLLTGYRIRSYGASWYTLVPLLLIALIMMEPRFLLRPELFTYLFLTLNLIILDRYTERKQDRLCFLPVIMLLWCNMQGLYMLGFLLPWTYFVSLWMQRKRPDLRLLSWSLGTMAICLINPYGLDGLIFPFELLTRFQEGNIFHSHIKEFQSLFRLHDWTLKEYCFVLYLGISFVALIGTIKNRKVHDLVLWGTFCSLALLAIRNIPLFIIVSLPVTGRSLQEMADTIKTKVASRTRKRGSAFAAGTLCFIMALIIPRVITNAYYFNNLSYNKTGIGLDRLQQPEEASLFLLDHQLNGRFINSLSYGGWLSWRLDRPVFIDARLEVVKEPLYAEVVESWDGGLGKLIQKYQPSLVVYDYVRYFAWTPQLLELAGWHPVYLDGQSVIFAQEVYAEQIRFPDTGLLVKKYGLKSTWTPSEKKQLLETPSPSTFAKWLQGFYSKTPCQAIQVQNIASFFLQINQPALAERFFLETLRQSHCTIVSCYYALADIYVQSGEFALAKMCYRHLLEIEPTNETLRIAMTALQKPASNLKSKVKCISEAEATSHFNTGNRKYKSGDIPGAIEEYTLAIRLNPGHAKAYHNRGYLEAVELKRYLEAIRDFDSAIALDPGFSDAYLSRGSSRYGLNDLEGAIKDWKTAESLGNRQAIHLLRQHKR